MKRSYSFFAYFLMSAALVPSLALADHSSATGAVEAQACSFSQNLTLGSRGAQVRCLQDFLADEKVLAERFVTGYYGAQTKQALAKWQKSMGIPATGYFAARTREMVLMHVSGGGMHSDAADAHMTMTAATGTMPTEMNHMHATLDASNWAAKPTVALVAHPDAMGGWNLEVTTTNFRFAPEHVNTTPMEGEGHAHLYVDGKKITRLYGSWYYLSKDAAGAAGPHEVKVGLNGNDHAQFVVNGAEVVATTTVTVQ